MAELTTAVNELLKGRRVEENLHIYTEGMASLYRRMAYLRMSMNFYTLAEIINDKSGEKNDKTGEMRKEVCGFVNRAVLEADADYASLREEAAALRSRLTALMEVLTAYTDRFQVYEHMLNRIEFRFADSGFTDSYYNSGFEDDIMKYVTSDKDNSAINMKIALVVSQLPMRLSNGKFFDIIKNTFTLYKSSDRTAIDDFVYMIRTAGLLYKPQGFENFTEFAELDAAFLETDFAKLSSEEYESLRSRLDGASELVREYSDNCIMLTEIVNDVYTLALTDGAFGDVNEKQKLTEAIGEAYAAIKENRAPSEEIYGIFDEVAGLQEKTMQLIYTPELALEGIKEANASEIERLGMRGRLDTVSKLAGLHSASTFARLENETEDDQCPDGYAMEAADKLTEEFTSLFENAGRMFKRAVMSSVIGNLPVFFNSLEEFGGYVRVALGQCSDGAERQACMSLINMLIVGE